jgi:nitrogen fixation NifU-like protein
MDHFTSPRNVGRIEAADSIGYAGTVGQGPYVVVYLRICGATVVSAKYQSHGCGATIASGSMLTELVRDRTIGECQEITSRQLIDALGGVPPDKLHCPELAITALRDALARFSRT